ncbi:MAG: cupin domain-containing protein [Rhodospirillales bacterium]|nr:cupin domain-containing protein [Rhodospirillales bacterium]
MIAARALDLPARTGSDYPAPHSAPCLARIRRALGDAFGLSQFGVNLLDLPPGTWSSQRHWHEQQDEFVYVLEGEVVLVTDEGESVLTPGMTAGFRAGSGNGHHLVNRSNRIARVLEVGTRTVEEVAHYSDIDMMVREDASGWGYFTKDGRPLK